ncbi:MAG TPA: MFS transporter [Gemmatimonadales bacterium]|nr:MFS transporter [Gemmatimonadales bacterium]
MSDASPDAAPGATGSRAYAVYALGLFTLINLLNYTDRNVVFALFQPIKRALALSDQQLGWLGSAYVIVLSLAALPLGVIGDLKSRRAVIAGGVALWSLFTALCATVTRFWQLLVYRALVGVGEAGYAPAAQALIAELFQGKRRAFAIGVYSVGMVFGGVLGIWVGGLLGERYGWRVAFVAVGIPGFLLAALASRLREPRRAAPLSLRRTVAAWYERGRAGVRQALLLAEPLIWLALGGALVSGTLALFRGVPPGLVTAPFAAGVSAGIIWTVVRLVPLAVQRTTEAGEVAATALGDFGQAAATVLRTPTLIWMFLGGALVTFAVNGLIAWAPSFLERTHGLSMTAVGRQFGVWGLMGGALGGLFGGRVGDALLARWSGGRVVVSGAGFVLGGPVCAALLWVDELKLFVPLLLATFFLYSWYNGPLSAVILDVVPPAVRASVIGGYVLFSHLAGDAIAPPLIGYLSDHIGLRPAMLVLPAAGAVGGGVILIALATVGRDMQRARAA